MSLQYNPSVFYLRQNPPPFTQGRLRAVGKGCAISIEAEKIGFMDAEQILDNIGIKIPLPVS